MWAKLHNVSAGPDTPAVEVTSSTAQRGLRADLMTGTMKTSGTASTMGSSNYESRVQSATSFAQNHKLASKLDLATVQEELVVEDGCENELENSR